jgi:hypothetical protein
MTGLVAQAGEELGAVLVLGDRGVQELDRHLPRERRRARGDARATPRRTPPAKLF